MFWSSLLTWLLAPSCGSLVTLTLCGTVLPSSWYKKRLLEVKLILRVLKGQYSTIFTFVLLLSWGPLTIFVWFNGRAPITPTNRHHPTFTPHLRLDKLFSDRLGVVAMPTWGKHASAEIARMKGMMEKKKKRRKEDRDKRLFDAALSKSGSHLSPEQ